MAWSIFCCTCSIVFLPCSGSADFEAEPKCDGVFNTDAKVRSTLTSFVEKGGRLLAFGYRFGDSFTRSNLRELLPDRYVERKILEYGIRNSTKIIVQTEAQAALLEENYDIESAEVIRNFHPLPTEAMEKNSQNTVLWVANFKKLKQPEVFIRLARDLVDTDARFIMIGAPAGGQWQQELDKQISSTENLAYLGVQSQQEVNRLLAAAQLLVNTSQYEGFSNTFIQAWMRRVPVISLKVNPDNLLSDGALGFCADDHYEKLRRQVSYLLGNAEVMARAGSQAQSYAFEHYSEKNVRRLISLLDNP